MTRPLTIATAERVNAKQWYNRQVEFEFLLEKLKSTTRTMETMAEYRSMKSQDKLAAKDHGGFVGGAVKDKTRDAKHILSRSMLTLDADNAEPGIVDKLKEASVALAVYSTHGHTPDAPRVRVIIPLTRDVTPDEYNAISRYFADSIGINQFDPVSFIPHQLMFWPSTSKDGEYIFCTSSSDSWLNPDEVLSSHPDWKDITTLPKTEKESALRVSKLKAEDPVKKGGVIGAFCSVYPIEDAISTFLSDVYEPSEVEGRYSYKEADSVAGVILYEGKYAYSHHASDPAFEKLLNAFDLVRVHRFGSLDKDADSDTRVSRLPSYKAMMEFAIEDDKVKLFLSREKMKEAGEDFAEGSDEWKTKLKFMPKSTTVQNSVENELLILNNDPDFASFAYNEMANRIEVTGPLPWSRPEDNKYWRDADTAQLKALTDMRYGVFSDRNHTVAFTKVADDRRFHPVRDYLLSLPEWDGIERLDTLFIDRLGAEDSPYVRAVTRKTLVAAVARIFHPGCKFDSVTVLDGEQGIGKSTIWKALAGEEFFSDALSLFDMNDKSGAEKLQGFWIMEIGELAGMKKADIEKVKSFISTSDDKYRPSYGRVVESHPRQCVVVATVNGERGYLRDITGNRRFWIIKCNQKEKKVGWKIDSELRDQIWAEAYFRFMEGEQLYLEDNLVSAAEEIQAEAMEVDEREGMVADYLDMLIPDNWEDMDIGQRRNYIELYDSDNPPVGSKPRQFICNMAIWVEALNNEPKSITPRDSYALTSIMKQQKNWNKYDGTADGTRRYKIYGKQRSYERKTTEELVPEVFQEVFHDDIPF